MKLDSEFPVFHFCAQGFAVSLDGFLIHMEMFSVSNFDGFFVGFTAD